MKHTLKVDDVLNWFIFFTLYTSAYKQELNNFMQLQLCNVLMKQTLFVDDIDCFSFSCHLNDYANPKNKFVHAIAMCYDCNGQCAIIA